MPIETGIIECDTNSKVNAYKEKVSLDVTTSIPVFFCTNEIFKSENIQKGKDFSYNVIPEFIAENAVFLYIENENYHYDVGTPERLRKISEVFKIGKVGIEPTIK